MSEEKIINFRLLNNDWMKNDQKDSHPSTSIESYSSSNGLELELPASYNQWISIKKFGNSLQIIFKKDQTAKDNALNCLESYWKAVLERYFFASEDSYLPDITLEVGPEKTLFNVHKFILALGCDVFKAMFFGQLAEKGEKVIIPDIPSDGFKILLRYFYGTHIVLTDKNDAFNALIAADKYCVQQVIDAYENFFRCCTLSGKNVWKLYETALFLNMKPLISLCEAYIQKHTEASLCGRSFLEAKLQTVKQIFNLPVVRVSELFLMKTLVHWGRNQVKIGKALSLRAALLPLLPNFRFGALTPDEFCKFLDDSHDLLAESDALDILKHITRPLAYPLPEWCCGIKWSRSLNLCERSFTQYQCIQKYLEYKKRNSNTHKRRRTSRNISLRNIFAR